MNLRAIVFDVYGTLLQVGPPPSDAPARWRATWERFFKTRPRLEWAEHLIACDAAVRREHVAARARGIPHPEVYWPAIVRDVVPEVGSLSPAERERFSWAESQLRHTTTLMPGAASVLRLLLASGVILGIASNAQPHTLRELDERLRAVGLDSQIFSPGLTFWSFQHGFSKPDPHVFQVLNARLLASGVKPEETLMVGDRIDNDVAPALACGWMTFHLIEHPTPSLSAGGLWHELAQWLEGRLR